MSPTKVGGDINNIKSKVSCRANQQMLHDHQYSRDIKYLNIICCIVVFSVLIGRFFGLVFFQEFCPPFSLWDAKHFE